MVVTNEITKQTVTTSISNPKYKSGHGSQTAEISDAQLKEFFGYTPRGENDRFLMSQQLLAQDRQSHS